jgi:hypothetical protein
MKGWVPNYQSENIWENAETLTKSKAESGGAWASAHDGSADNTFRSAHHHYTCHGWAIPWNRLWTEKAGKHTHSVSIAAETAHKHTVKASIDKEALAKGLNDLNKTIDCPDCSGTSFSIVPSYQKCYMYKRTE